MLAPEAEKRLRAAMLEAGWRVEQPTADDSVDLLAHREEASISIVAKRVGSAAWPVIQGAMADAILRARKHASDTRTYPMAVIAAPRLSARMLLRLSRYCAEYAHDVSWGALDDDGLVELNGLVRANVAPLRPQRGTDERRVNIWSDMGQWVMKVLVGRTLGLLDLAAVGFTSATNARFADEIGVSRSFAWEVVAQLRRDGFMDDDNRVLNLPDLLETWRRRHERAIAKPMNWLIPPKNTRQKLLPLLTQGSGRACLAGFSACRQRRVSIVPEGILDVHVRTPEIVASEGLVAGSPAERPDVLIRIPSTPNAIFRAASREGPDDVASADLIQCWLDLVDEPGRGREQADAIWRDTFRLP